MNIKYNSRETVHVACTGEYITALLRASQSGVNETINFLLSLVLKQ